ncbi:MAG: adenylate/guanylate cyclase domain-containing protein [Gammaproteobacteria bacterium]|nr:MAG: adenylate/guanylate cyclase domain-containing protein [Gammaproteobacteria bacterium]
MEPGRTLYARSGDIHVAYQVFGEGEVDLVFVPGFISHIVNSWEEPGLAEWLRRRGSFSRVIMFDKQGTGLSDRGGELPGMDERMDDVRAVMDAENIERAAIFGISEGGSLATLFAATHPDRCRALILYGAFARFKSWFPTKEALQGLMQYVDRDWGSGQSLPMFAPGRKDDLAFQQWWGRFERLGASPGAVKTLMRMNSRIDTSDILASVNVPTLVIHRKEDVAVSVEGGRFLAEQIHDAKYVELAGVDHLPWVGENRNRILDEMAKFLTGEWRPVEADRILATVLFTDIVESTKRAAEMGDQQWRDLLDRHNTMMHKNIVRFRGRAIKSTGDGFLATFDGPARAIRCASAASEAARQIGMEIQAGLHTGEIELMGDDIGGIAVHIASRVLGQAGDNEVWVSRTVRDLVVGSDFAFRDQGLYELKGVPGEWQLIAVEL